MQITIDGFVSGPNGELDWMTFNMDEKLIGHINDLTDTSDTILLGRKMTDGFVNYWTNALEDPASPENAFAKKMVDYRKVVFTKTLDESSWKNTELARGDLAAEIAELKGQSGRDIVVYGGAGFVTSLIGEDLIDEYNFFVNPVMIGKGLTISTGISGNRSFKLDKSSAFECGIVVNRYVRA